MPPKSPVIFRWGAAKQLPGTSCRHTAQQQIPNRMQMFFLLRWALLTRTYCVLQLFFFSLPVACASGANANMFSKCFVFPQRAARATIKSPKISALDYFLFFSAVGDKYNKLGHSKRREVDIFFNWGSFEGLPCRLQSNYVQITSVQIFWHSSWLEACSEQLAVCS